MEWTAFYEGAVYRSETTAWADLPDGIVWLVERLEGRRNHYKGDWYWLDQGSFHRVPPTISGEPWAGKPDVSCQSCIKRGVYVSDTEFERVRTLAWSEPWL